MQGARKIAALLLAAIAGALLIAWVDPGSPDLADLRVKRMLFAPLPSPDIALLDGASFAPAQEPFRHQGRFGVARIEFDVPDAAAADLALFIRRVRDNYAVYVNGKLAAPTPGTLGERSTLHGFLPRLVKILPALLVPGKNKIDIVSARNATQTALREVYLGPASSLEPAYLHTRTAIHDAGFITALAAGIVLLFALALSSLIRNPVLIRVIAIVLALFLLRELHALWVDRAWPQMYRDIYLILVATWLWISLAAFANEWTGGPATLRKWFAAGAAAAAALIVMFYVVLPSCHEAYAAGSWVESLAGLGALAFSVWRLVRHYRAAEGSAAAEIFVAGVGMIMALALFATQTAVMPGFAAIVSIEGEAFTKLGAMSMIALIALGLARQGVAVYQQAALNNEALSRKVEVATRELEANHILLREQDRERALADERGRIMRDVHDGIGSQLLGLMIQARAGGAKEETLIAGLQAAIDDLYLVVDSLDGVPGSLETALGTFRGRIEPKCAAAGIEVAWQMEQIGETPSVGPTTVLQIYRILQEALSNAVRHAKPKRLTFAVARNAQDPAKIEISLRDDGPGIPAAALTGPGRGLANMKKRAASIGAELRIENRGDGSCVQILLPA
jgi:signal transduction histidine kinase